MVGGAQRQRQAQLTCMRCLGLVAEGQKVDQQDKHATPSKSSGGAPAHQAPSQAQTESHQPGWQQTIIHTTAHSPSCHSLSKPAAPTLFQASYLTSTHTRPRTLSTLGRSQQLYLSRCSPITVSGPSCLRSQLSLKLRQRRGNDRNRDKRRWAVPPHPPWGYPPPEQGQGVSLPQGQPPQPANQPHCPAPQQCCC